MSWWRNLKSWFIRLLGGYTEPSREFHFAVDRPMYLPPDRPFEVMDWERLLTMPQRERELFEWLAHRIRALDAKASGLPDGPEGDRGRLVCLARRDEVMRMFHVGTEAGNKLAQIMDRQRRQEQLQSVGKAMQNYG